MTSIKCRTVLMKPPKLNSEGNVIRQPENYCLESQEIINAEGWLRKKAYSKTQLSLGESFFTDEDMSKEYYLIVVFEKSSNTPLLSMRYFYNKSVIKQLLMGDSNGIIEENQIGKCLNLLKQNDVFLIDRMSANTESKTYRKHRNYINLAILRELMYRTPGQKFFAMARSIPSEKLLIKYIRMGFSIGGSITHNKVKHWVLFTDWNSARSNVKGSIGFYLGLFSFNKFRRTFQRGKQKSIV